MLKPVIFELLFSLVYFWCCIILILLHILLQYFSKVFVLFFFVLKMEEQKFASSYVRASGMKGCKKIILFFLNSYADAVQSCDGLQLCFIQNIIHDERKGKENLIYNSLIQKSSSLENTSTLEEELICTPTCLLCGNQYVYTWS